MPKKAQTKAPSIEELQQEAEELHNEESETEIGAIPTVSIIGCGGCGINLVKKLYDSLPNPDYHDWHAVDTSHANLGLSGKLKENTHLIADTGAGKVRSTHANRVQSSVLAEAVPLNDVNIIVFSLSGGSGSVIGPLLARSMGVRKKAVVLVGVASKESMLDTNNTINTIKTLTNISQKDKIYLPLMLFDNSYGKRSEVNESVVARVTMLVDMLTNTSIREIDYSDRMNFLQPNRIDCATEGLYLLGITDSPAPDTGITLPGEYETTLRQNQRVHSMMAISPDATPGVALANVSYVGVGAMQYLAVCGMAIPRELIASLNRTRDQYISIVDDQDLQFEDADVGSRIVL